MKRTKHSKKFKLQVIKEAQETGKITLVARRYELNPNMVGRWIREYKDGKYGDVDVLFCQILIPKNYPKKTKD